MEEKKQQLQKLIEKTIKQFEDENQVLMTSLKMEEVGQHKDLSTEYDFDCSLTDMTD
jgi:hypothetical protein